MLRKQGVLLLLKKYIILQCHTILKHEALRLEQSGEVRRQ